MSRGPDGEPADGGSWGPLVSGDGDTVLFTSTATNLIRTKLPADPHLFAWDRRTRRTRLVGVLPDGSPAIASASDVSADGRVLLFTTDAAHQWMRDQDSGTTVAVEPSAELTPEGRLVTYQGLPSGWTPTGAASEDGRYVALQTWGAGSNTSPYGGSYPVSVWDAATGATVHEAEIRYGEMSTARVKSLTDDGRLGLVERSVRGDMGGEVMDMTTGTVLVADAVAITGDARYALTRIQWWGMTLTDRSSGSSVRLVRRPLVDEWSPGAGLDTAGVTPDGSTVAYSHDGDDLLRGAQSRFSQVYLWHDRSAERPR